MEQLPFLNQGVVAVQQIYKLPKDQDLLVYYPRDQLLADCGFALEEKFAAECSSELFIPAFTKGQKQLTTKEVETTRQITTVRIHLEPIIGEIKNHFRILDGPLPITSFHKIINR